MERRRERDLQRLVEIVEEVLAHSPIFLVEARVRGVQSARVVEVFVDGDDGPNVADLARISREVGFLLDMEDIIPGRYRLDVSTPGLDRPLVLPRQYGKHVGRDLSIRTRCAGDDHARANADAGHSRFTEIVGRLLAVRGDAVEVALPDADARRIRFDDIIQANVRLPW